MKSYRSACNRTDPTIFCLPYKYRRASLWVLRTIRAGGNCRLGCNAICNEAKHNCNRWLVSCFPPKNKERKMVKIRYISFQLLCNMLGNRVFDNMLYRHRSIRMVCVCSGMLMIYFQTPRLVCANCGRPYLTSDGQRNPPSSAKSR